jgi:beta-phosphoglucomutase family hydrolase
LGTSVVTATAGDDTGPSVCHASLVVRLPDAIRGCLFDMDGVLTDTASTHARAWKRTFDELLERHTGQAPFDLDGDYKAYVDGKTRYDGVRSFLESRGIQLPEGTPDDSPEMETIAGVGNRKNELVQRLIAEDGVVVYEGSVRFVEEARSAGLATAVVSSSANTNQILESAGITHLFDARVDGVVIAEEGLRGKPAPDSFLRGAELLGLQPEAAAVFEDALAGVEAGKAGDFGLVVGVDRHGQPDALREHGGDVVVEDLAELIG